MKQNSRRNLAAQGGVTTALLMGLACGGEGEIEQPTPLYGAVPIDYPIQLWDQDMEGQTMLRVRVPDTGTVDSVEWAHLRGQVVPRSSRGSPERGRHQLGFKQRMVH